MYKRQLQAVGYATCLKILFELNEGDEISKQDIVDKLTKYELVALLNTFNLLSETIEYVNDFETIYNKQALYGGENQMVSFFKKHNFFKLLKAGTKNMEQKIKEFKDLNVPPEGIVEEKKAAIHSQWENVWDVNVGTFVEGLDFIERKYFTLVRQIKDWFQWLLNRVRH